MVALVAALSLASWAHALAFQPLPGWQTGASGNLRSHYSGHAGGTESAAWIARNVRYVDRATADPPNRTVERLPPEGVIVWAVIWDRARAGQGPIRLDLGRAKRFDCCEGTYVPGGLYELSGAGPGGSYSTIVRVFFGSRPTPATRAAAQRALDRLELPPSR